MGGKGIPSMSRTLPTEAKTEEMNSTWCDEHPEPSQDILMNDSGKSRQEVTGGKMEFLSANTNTIIGFWNARTIYET